jgi:hypothetical protein
MFFDDEDRLWVQTTKKDYFDAYVFDVFDKNGKYYAEVIFNPQRPAGKFKIKNNSFYCTKKDEYDLRSLVRYKILEE